MVGCSDCVVFRGVPPTSSTGQLSSSPVIEGSIGLTLPGWNGRWSKSPQITRDSE